ncbi:MAG: hypothetical protein LBE35_08835 [Clostridiales bacterium]|jgi:hypothetical protein|nr:hypothetical protein [Clostridiales bacterium]
MILNTNTNNIGQLRQMFGVANQRSAASRPRPISIMQNLQISGDAFNNISAKFIPSEELSALRHEENEEYKCEYYEKEEVVKTTTFCRFSSFILALSEASERLDIRISRLQRSLDNGTIDEYEFADMKREAEHEFIEFMSTPHPQEPRNLEEEREVRELNRILARILNTISEYLWSDGFVSVFDMLQDSSAVADLISFGQSRVAGLQNYDKDTIIGSSFVRRFVDVEIPPLS